MAASSVFVSWHGGRCRIFCCRCVMPMRFPPLCGVFYIDAFPFVADTASSATIRITEHNVRVYLKIRPMLSRLFIKWNGIESPDVNRARSHAVTFTIISPVPIAIVVGVLYKFSVPTLGVVASLVVTDCFVQIYVMPCRLSDFVCWFECKIVQNVCV